jgi:hypothetical protein
MANERPTMQATFRFGHAANKGYLLPSTPTDFAQLAWALNELVAGLLELTKAVRQSYALLEEIRNQLQHQRPPGRL